jgi:hypothetical protein
MNTFAASPSRAPTHQDGTIVSAQTAVQVQMSPPSAGAAFAADTFFGLE